MTVIGLADGKAKVLLTDVVVGQMKGSTFEYLLTRTCPLFVVLNRALRDAVVREQVKVEQVIVAAVNELQSIVEVAVLDVVRWFDVRHQLVLA